MLTRRKFLLVSTLCTSTLAVHPYISEKSKLLSKRFDKVVETIVSIQLHMFPLGILGHSLPLQALENFLRTTLFEPRYDPDIRLFVIEGAERFIAINKTFVVSMKTSQKEKQLRQYEETNYGSAWLSRIMTLTMEALFSDPIYAVNSDEKMWKMLQTYGGYPRPKSEYMQDV